MTAREATSIREALHRSGMAEPEAHEKVRRFVQLIAALPPAAADTAASAWYVPGRLEVIGKHTDYCGGRSLVCAVERGLCLATRTRGDDVVRISETQGGSRCELSLGESPQRRDAPHWAIYPAAVVRRLARNFPSARRGADIVFDSDLPAAAGLSSSSALVTAILLALAEINELRVTDVWRRTIPDCEALASYAAAIENGADYQDLRGDSGVGTAGGSEDHLAILCSSPGQIAQYSFSPLRLVSRVVLSDDLVFVVAVSGVVARKTGNARAQYNRAARLASRALELWNEVQARRDESLAAALRSGPHAAEAMRDTLECGADAEFDRGDLIARFEQFVEESEHLVPTGTAQLLGADLEGFAQTAARSQDLAERLLRNQVPETIALARLAREAGALAGSAFGAGFGGSAWALVTSRDASTFASRWAELYGRSHPMAARDSQFFTTRPGPCALRLPVSL